MIVLDETTGVCTADRQVTRTYVQPIGCGNHLPLGAFSDVLRSTICDMCKWRLNIERERIAPNMAWLLCVYPPENKYQRAARQKQIKRRAEVPEAYIAAASRILQRGEKVSIETLSAETGYTKSNVYKHFPARPVQTLTALAESRLLVEGRDA